MDEKDKKIKELEDKLAATTAERDTAFKERDTFKSDNEKLAGDIKKKDDIISQKNQDIIGARKQYKKMSDRTKEELDSMTDAEKEALKRQEEQDKRLEDLAKENSDFKMKEVNSRKATIIAKYAGKNPEIAKKIEENLAKLNPEELAKATTVEELTPLVEFAYNGLGIAKPNPINGAIGGGNGEAPNDSENKGNFADSPEGQAFLGKIAPQAVEKKQ